MPEKQIEKRFRLAVKARGGLSLKLTTPGFTGIPDRLNLLPGGRVIFCEFKFGGNKLSVRQEAVIRVLRGLGFACWIVDEFNIDEYIKLLD
jgi:hypothetical protein